MININKLLKTGLFLVVIFSILSFISVLFVDRWLALTIHFLKIDTIRPTTLITEDGPFIIVIAFLLFLLFIFQGHSIVQKFFLIVYIAVLTFVAGYAKTLLKILFGRYWPATWHNDNISLIHNSVYGFHWWHGYGNMGSFPSGHTTFITVLSLSMLIIYPRLKALWIACIVIMIAGLVALNFHFLGDCLAGVALGSFFAYFGMALYFKAQHYIYTK